MSTRYVRPDWFTTNVFNRLVAGLTRIGISVLGSRILAVRGRKTGQWRTTPVNLLTHEGSRYLVAPRGVTQWVRNVRAGSDVELRIGRRSEAVTLVELPEDEKLPVLRAYLRRWKVEIGAFFQGVGPDAPEAELARIAPGYPAFRVEPHQGAG
ncbi:MAG: nitroreductase family deazaflavin-dependent oxidoreductase [Candidatus Dormibacteria bacterium]|jgi:deazaflavin-dependent oxidoreductase (nitroreductase family)